jgi:hypothetical protein
MYWYAKKHFEEGEWSDDEIEWLSSNITELMAHTPAMWASSTTYDEYYH